ncbi:MAG: hypothetical protein M3Y64_02695 [Gemmatimonadota bacterium]|nr:hypothetical protein [Gemmatimonadota bacterium]
MRTFFCQHCGEFAIADVVESGLDRFPSRYLVALGRATNDANVAGTVAQLTLQTVSQLLIKYLGEVQTLPGDELRA